MQRKIIGVFRRAFLLAVVLVSTALSAVGAAAEPVMQVGILTGCQSVRLTATRDVVLRDLAGGRGIMKVKANSPLNVLVRNRQLVINGKPVAARRIMLENDKGQSDVRWHVDGTVYRGNIRLSVAAAGLNVINEVALEDYVKGVVPGEMSTGWPIEALKAQAVAARTFAVYSKNKHNDEGFDVCDGTHCQAYGGVSDEQPDTNRAVEATRGQLLYFDGKPIYAAFHADSGGFTADSEEVWGGSLPYLRCVADAGASPGCHWQVTYIVADVESKLRAAGKNIGTLKNIRLSALDIARPSAADRYRSGRVKAMTFVGSSGSVTVNGTQARQIFGLKSALFSIVGKSKAFSTSETKAAATRPAAKKAKSKDKKKAAKTETAKNDTAPVSEFTFSSSGAPVVFDGYGLGHGLGMAQWGARYLAQQGKLYQDILQYFYTGVEIKRLY